MARFRYYDEGARPERAQRPQEGESFFSLARAEGAAPPAFALVAPDDPGIYYVGRFAQRAIAQPAFAWQGSQLLARFEGRRIGFRFARVTGRCFFNVIVDGTNRLLALREGGPDDYVADFELGAGEHELVLYKRSEGYFGSAVLLGLLVEDGSRLGARPEPLPLRIEFYGDSITAGACDDDPGEDQYDDLSTHDNYLSYGAKACRALGAEYVSIAVSGIGLTCSWNPILMLDAWDKVVPDPAAERWNFSGRSPDAVVINLGQNDYGFPNSQGLPLSPDFAPRYVSFARAIRDVYPRSLIVCAMGGMTAYRDSAEIRAAWSKAMDEIRSADSSAMELRFEAFSSAHPREPVHRALAEELEAFLRAKLIGR